MNTSARRAGRNPGLFVFERGLKSCAAGQTTEAQAKAPGMRWGRMGQTGPAMMRPKRGQKSETHLEMPEKGETGCVLFGGMGRARRPLALRGMWTGKAGGYLSFRSSSSR